MFRIPRTEGNKRRLVSLVTHAVIVVDKNRKERREERTLVILSLSLGTDVGK
jgi:hypothetical protein